jgi:hypothetical protein
MIHIETMPGMLCLSRGGRAPSLTVKHTVKRYAAAYKAVYGVEPTVDIQGEWIRVRGLPDRVKRTRLKELAEQLEYRAGSRG